MRRNSQRLLDHIQFLGLVTVLYIQISVRVIVKRISNKSRRACCKLSAHRKSRVLLVVLLFEFQNTPAHLHIYIYIYIYIMLGSFNTYNLTHFDPILLISFTWVNFNLFISIRFPLIVCVK